MRMSTFSELLLSKVLNVILFYVGWLYVVKSAVDLHPYRGICGAILIIIFQIAVSRHWLEELWLLISVVLVGLILDSIYINTGMLSYVSPNPISDKLAPLWILALYGLFSITVNHSLAWIKKVPILAMLLGALGGTISYFVGAKMGAITFNMPQGLVFTVIAVVWFLFLPLVCYYTGLLSRFFGLKH